MGTLAEELAALAITDNFNRKEFPLASEWKLLEPGEDTGQCNNVAGVEDGWLPVAEGTGAAYWSKTSLTPGEGEYAASIFRISVMPEESGQYRGLWVFRDPTTPKTVKSGYFLRIEYKGANKFKFSLEKWTAGAKEVLKSTETTAYKAESRIALVVGGGKVMMFASKEAASAFEEVLSVTSSTYTSGYSGIMGQGTNAPAFCVRDFRTAAFAAAEPSVTIVAPPASATGSLPSPSPAAVLSPPPASATADSSSVEAVVGPTLSPTDHKRGLPLPFPSILANPARLGPPRFTASERKTLRMR